MNTVRISTQSSIAEEGQGESEAVIEDRHPSNTGVESSLTLVDLTEYQKKLSGVGREKEEEESEEPKKGCERCAQVARRTVGLQLAFLSAVFTSLSSYFVYRLVRHRKYDPSHCVIARFLLITLLSPIILSYVELWQDKHVLGVICPLNRRAHIFTFFKLIGRGMAGATAIVLQIYALRYIHQGDVSVILYSNPFFVSIAAHFILKEKCGFFTLFLGILTIVGVMIVARPPFIVGGKQYEKNIMIGIILALLSMLATTVAIIVIRRLKHIHYSLLTISFGFMGLLSGLIISGATDKIESRGPVPDMSVTVGDIFQFLALGTLAFTGITLNTIALHYEHAGPVSIIRSSEVIFSFLWQMISNVFPDAYSLAGGAIILFCVFLTGIKQYVGSLPEDRKCRRRLCFLLK